MNRDSLEKDLGELKEAARALRSLPRAKKDAVLAKLGSLLSQKEAEVLAANAKDLALLPDSASGSFRDRLSLNKERLKGMRESLSAVQALPDPVGEITEEKTLSGGVLAKKIRAPLGVLFLIFESRPNVAIEAFSLAFKSGNVILLRGGKESLESVTILVSLIQEALAFAGVPSGACQSLTDPDRSLIETLLSRPDVIDIAIPRGGEKLIEFVSTNAKMPVIRHDRGLCHIYVHQDADPEMAETIIENAKVQRPGVCNAMETLLVHEKRAATFLPRIFSRLSKHGVKWNACLRSFSILSPLPGASGLVRLAKETDFDTEYLDLEMSCKVVDSLDDAILHIELHGSRHSEAIVTASEPDARKFQGAIDAAAVYWNASTRFTDGFAMGLGGEMGISTQKLHVRGPVGLRELTSVRWILDGHGEIRE